MNDCKKIKLLHLFPKLFSLYGEYGNIKIIEKELTSHGYEVEVSYFEGYKDTTPDLSDIDFIYVGSGCEKDIKTAVSRLSVIKESLSEYIAFGKVMLASGNSMSLLGKSVTVGKGDSIDALGIFDYSSTLFTDKRFLGDALSSESELFGAPVIGFINNSMVINDPPSPIFEFALGEGLGNDKCSNGDGFIINSFIASQLIGPICVKNPHVLAKICSMITNELFVTDSASNAYLAYERGLKALLARCGK